jgi:hypothetical protein
MHLEYFRFSSGLRNFLEARFLYYSDWQDVQALPPVSTEVMVIALKLPRSLKGPGKEVVAQRVPSSAHAAQSRISFRSTPMTGLTGSMPTGKRSTCESGRSGCLRNRPHTARSERSRFSDHLCSLVESSIAGWRSAEICPARADHGNLRTWTARHARCRRVIQRRAQRQQTDQILNRFARRVTTSGIVLWISCERRWGYCHVRRAAWMPAKIPFV